MPTLTCLHLTPRGGMHLGARGVEQEETRDVVPSDSLFAALVAAALPLYGRPAAWAAAVGEPDGVPFLLTSAYPRAGAVRFYPVPRVDLATLGLRADPKALRRVQFLSEGLWRRVVDGSGLAGLWPEDGQDGVFLQGGALWLTREEVDGLPEGLRLIRTAGGGTRPRPMGALVHHKVWDTHKAPRVTVDRTTHAGAIYHTGRLTFAPGCGLWFGVAWRRPEDPLGDEGPPWREVLERTLTALGDAGLGGDRAAGLGGLSWEPGGHVEWRDPRPGDYAVTLSRYHPRADELPAALEGEAVRYALQSVAGYLSTPQAAAQRRRRLWLIAEGSVVRALKSGVMGDVVDVRPCVGDFPHPVWRYGLALTVRLEVNHD